MTQKTIEFFVACMELKPLLMSVHGRENKDCPLHFGC